MTEATAIPVNLYQNDRELVVVAPMPGVAADDIAIEVTDAGEMTLTCAEHGLGQERIEYLVREWSYGPYLRRVQLPCAVDASRANVAYGNGVLSIAFPKAETTHAGTVDLGRTGHARGLALGHVGTRGGASAHPR
jgi:HSP20 family molecular chaperone IbpA